MKMIDTHGEAIPTHDGQSFFNLGLGTDASLIMRIPAFTTDSGTYTAENGMVKTTLRGLFDELLAQADHWENRPDEPISIASLLKEYLPKFEAMVAAVEGKKPLKGPSKEELDWAIAGITMVVRDARKERSH